MPSEASPPALSAWLGQLARRAGALRSALSSCGADGLLAERLLPLERLTRPGREPELSAARAADMTAQLLAFGLAHARAFSLREGAAAASGIEALARMPTTSPLLSAVLRAVLETLDQAGARGYVEGLCAWLDGDASGDVLREHGAELADAYDRFLQRYDPEARRAAGVYFTPAPLVDFMWRQVEGALREALGREAGLADPGLSLLDPAVGGGAFLVALCERLPPDARRQALAERVHGFEVTLPAYAACHLRLTSRLLSAGVTPPLPRVDVCLASALVPPGRQPEGQGDAFARAIAREAEAACALHEAPIDVVVGNPPYRRSSSNRHPVIDQRMGPYKRPLAGEPNLQPLADDYVKFFRRLEELLQARPQAVLSLVTPSTYLGGRLHRAMRASLLSTFARAQVLDLHGSARGERPAGRDDENVFGVGQGIAVGLFVRGAAPSVRHAELIGTRAHKLEALAAGALRWRALQPEAPLHLLTPRGRTAPEYARFTALTELFDFHSVAGKPGDDAVLVAFEREDVLLRLERARAQLGGAARPTEAMRKLARRAPGKAFDAARVAPYAYRPFDTRFVYDDPELWTRPVRELRTRVTGEPLLWVSRVVKDASFAHVFASRLLPDVIGLSPTSSVNCHVFPATALRPEVATRHLPRAPAREALFAYVYGVLHSVGYRRRYDGALRGDYPRIPWPRERALFEAIAELGGALLELHLGERAPADARAPRFVDGGDRGIARVGERGRRLLPRPGGAGRVHINDVSYFEPVPRAVYRHRVGGYQVCFKWLHDRRRARRPLGQAEVESYRRLVATLAETRGLMARLERRIRGAGGWPDAFLGDP